MTGTGKLEFGTKFTYTISGNRSTITFSRATGNSPSYWIVTTGLSALILVILYFLPAVVNMSSISDFTTSILQPILPPYTALPLILEILALATPVTLDILADATPFTLAMLAHPPPVGV